MAQNIPALQGLTEEKAAKKLAFVHEGREIRDTEPRFAPEGRPCNDCCWVIGFAVMLLAVTGVAGSMGRSISADDLMTPATTPAPLVPVAAAGLVTPAPAPLFLCSSFSCPPPSLANPNVAALEVNSTSAPFFCCQALSAGGRRLQYAQIQPTNETSTQPLFNPKNVKPAYLVLATMAGCGCAFVATLFLVFLSKACATCVVYTSLLFSCIVMILMGFAMILGGAAAYNLPQGFNTIFYMGGFVMIAMGCCFACCICCCWAQFIEFTARIVEHCGEITLENPCMFLVALIGAIVSAIWSIIVAFALDGVVAAYQTEIESSRYTSYAVFGAFFFCWIWGCMVSSGVCYTTFCGVFGRWYYSAEGHYEENVLMSSFCAASTSSLGSICFGTFLVAAVRTAEFIVRNMRQDAQEDGNIVLCIVLCCVQCILDCIGDIIEYFNEWAYVQCAIRGTSFCASAKIVFSLCTVANVWAIWSTLLIDSVVNFGSFLAGFCGAAVGAGIGYVGSLETCLLSALAGFIAGNTVGWCCMSTFTAGAKTLCTCWAENPETLFHKSSDDAEGDASRDLYQMFPTNNKPF